MGTPKSSLPKLTCVQGHPDPSIHTLDVIEFPGRLSPDTNQNTTSNSTLNIIIKKKKKKFVPGGVKVKCVSSVFNPSDRTQGRDHTRTYLPS